MGPCSILKSESIYELATTPRRGDMGPAEREEVLPVGTGEEPGGASGMTTSFTVQSSC